METKQSFEETLQLSLEGKLENNTEEFWKEKLLEYGVVHTPEETKFSYWDCAILLVQLKDCVPYAYPYNYIQRFVSIFGNSQTLEDKKKFFDRLLREKHGDELYKELYERLLEIYGGKNGASLLKIAYIHHYKELFFFIVDHIFYVTVKTSGNYDLIINDLIRNKDTAWLEELFKRLTKTNTMSYWFYILETVRIYINTKSQDYIKFIDFFIEEADKNGVFEDIRQTVLRCLRDDKESIKLVNERFDL
jgi:hypothetical protein